MARKSVPVEAVMLNAEESLLLEGIIWKRYEEIPDGPGGTTTSDYKFMLYTLRMKLRSAMLKLNKV